MIEEYIEDARLYMIDIAKETLKEELADGFDPNYIRNVDGKDNAREETVKAFGKIEYHARVDVLEVISKIWDIIDKNSPRGGTGTYAKNHVLMFNNREIGRNKQQSLEYIKGYGINFKSKDTLRFVNVMPYSYSLEKKGVTSGKPKATRYRLSKDQRGKKAGNMVKVPNGVYAVAARAAKRYFKKHFTVKDEYLPANYIGLSGTPNRNPPRQPNGSNSPWRHTFDPKGRFNKGYYIYPSILIVLKGSSIA